MNKAVEEFDDAIANAIFAAKPNPTNSLVDNVNRQKKLLDDLNDAVKKGNKPAVQKLLPEINDLNDRIVDHGRHEAEKKNPKERKELEDLLRGLDDLVKNALTPDAKHAAHHPNDTGAVKKVDDEVKKAKEALDRLLDKTAANPLAAAHALEDEFKRLAKAARADDPAAIVEATKGVADKEKEFVNSAKNFAEKIDDPTRKKNLLDALNELEKLLPSTVQAAKDHTGKTSPDNQQKLLDKVSENLDPLAAAIAALRPTPEGETARMVAKDLNALDRVAERAHKGDKPGTNDALVKAKEYTDALKKLAKDTADKTPNKDHRNRLNDAIKELDTLMAKLPEVARAAADDPKDKKKQDDLDNLISEIKEPIKTIEDITNNDNATSGEKIAEVRSRIDKIVAKARPGRGRKFDPKTLLDAAKALSDSVKDMVSTAKIEADKIPVNTDRAKAASELDQLLFGLEKAPASKPAPTQDTSKLLDELNKKASEIPPQSGLGGALSSVASDIAKATRDRPGLSDKDPILSLSQIVGIEIAKLGAAASKGNRQELLLCSKSFSTALNNLANELKNLAARVKDPRMADKLIRAQVALKNYATQAKILCSVKAASAKDSPDTDEQLITLTRSVGVLVNEGITVVETAKKTNRMN